MIKFTCRHCGAAFEAEDYQQGQDFACTTCGTALKVPAMAGGAPPQVVNSNDLIPVLAPATADPGSSAGRRVRFIQRGVESGAFHTPAGTDEIYMAFAGMLQRLGLHL